MVSPINNIARSALASPVRPLNILSFIYDGYFDSTLCEALPQHNFYIPITDSNKPSGWNFTMCPQPANLRYIPNFAQSNIASRVNFDLVLCHDRTSQYDTAQQLVHSLHLNTIILEHISNTTQLDLIGMIPLLKKTKNDTNVFVGNVSESLQIPGTTIKYGVPNLTNDKQDKKQNIVAAFNLDDTTIQNIQPHIKPLIHSYDINTLTQGQYYNILKESKFYFNLEAETTRLQLPVLYAMSAGCVVISMHSPSISDVITHMENGIIINNMEDLVGLFNKMDTVDTREIAQIANKYIVDNYNMAVFKQKWQEILTATAQKTYIR